MSIKLIWRACLAIIVGAALGYTALSLSTTDEGNPPASNSSRSNAHFAPKLALVRQARTGLLISLQINPFEVGQNDFRVALLDPLGRPLKLDSAQLRLSRLESADFVSESDVAGSAQSHQGAFQFPEAGWWQVDVTANSDSTTTFYVKLDQPSGAPSKFSPPDYVADPGAQGIFQAALARYQALTGLRWREELTSGERGPSGHGVWFITNIAANLQGFHATTLSPEQGSSELYSGATRQCFRHGRDGWQCSEGPAPTGAFDLSYLRNATGFKLGRREVIDGEMTQVIFFYNPSQSAWYAWWVGEKTHYVRRQAMVANGHFMLDHFSDHDVAVSIQPGDLPAQ
jgi:hypothetical protein